MKIKQEFMRVTRQPVFEDGTPVEPEQQTVTRVLELETTTTMNTGAPVPGGGSLPARMVVEAPAGEVAGAFSRLCANCKHFDRDRWNRWLARADHPMAPMPLREAVNEIRGAFLMSSNAKLGSAHEGADGDLDVESALKTLGFCGPLSEFYKESVGVHPLSSCPVEVVAPDRPKGFFVPRDREAARESGKAYDEVIKTAAGKL